MYNETCRSRLSRKGAGNTAFSRQNVYVGKWGRRRANATSKRGAGVLQEDTRAACCRHKQRLCACPGRLHHGSSFQAPLGEGV